MAWPSSAGFYPRLRRGPSIPHAGGAPIADDNPDAAQELKDEIEAKADKLPDHLYKPSVRVKGLRELIMRSNYIVFYRESPELVEIVNVVHARRQWPLLKHTAST